MLFIISQQPKIIINMEKREAILRIRCPDAKGIIHKITGFILGNNGNILELEQFVDQNENEFFMRVVWDMAGFNFPLSDFNAAFSEMQKELSATYWIDDPGIKGRMAVFVSRELHCLAEALSQRYMGNLWLEIPAVISNHEEAREITEKFDIEFIHIPTKGADMKEVEKKQLDILESRKVDFIGLARYMRILSANFVERYRDRIINIHHSFLPAFAGADPYKQAHDRGVKIIGATAHFVSEKLDQGPIIAQGTKEVHHGYSVGLLRQIGQEVEKKVFIQALQKYIQRKIIRHRNKTVIFE